MIIKVANEAQLTVLKKGRELKVGRDGDDVVVVDFLARKRKLL